MEALRAHDSDTLEALADSRPRSGSWEEEAIGEAVISDGESGFESDQESEGLDGGGSAEPVSAGARELLKFSSPRDTAQLARFVRLRVLEAEGEYWRRGIEACVRYVKETGAVQLRVPYSPLSALASGPAAKWVLGSGW